MVSPLLNVVSPLLNMVLPLLIVVSTLLNVVLPLLNVVRPPLNVLSSLVDVLPPLLNVVPPLLLLLLFQNYFSALLISPSLPSTHCLRPNFSSFSYFLSPPSVIPVCQFIVPILDAFTM